MARLTKLPPLDARLVAVCDLDPAKAERAAQRFGGTPYTDMAAMLAQERPDLVDVVTQISAYRALVETAATAGIGMIVQKPLAPNWQDCVAIAETATSAGVFFAVHENFRFQTPMRRVRALIDKGAIGQPSFARISFRTGFDVYRNQPYFLTEPRLKCPAPHLLKGHDSPDPPDPGPDDPDEPYDLPAEIA